MNSHDYRLRVIKGTEHGTIIRTIIVGSIRIIVGIIRIIAGIIRIIVGIIVPCSE